jgi:fatty-acid desaturase
MKMTDKIIKNGASNMPCSALTAQRLAAAIGVFVPFLGLVVAIYGLGGWGVTWMELVLLIAMYTATGLGVTVGYHRLFAHRSFDTVGPVKFILGLWRNNHHAFLSSARHGLKWWQLDVSYLVICAMALLGLARQMRVPARSRIVNCRNHLNRHTTLK